MKDFTEAQLVKIKDHVAPDGYVWVCAACGKMSMERTGQHPNASPGWDVSCFLNAVLVGDGDYILGENGRVCQIDAIAYNPRDGFHTGDKRGLDDPREGS